MEGSGAFDWIASATLDKRPKAITKMLKRDGDKTIVRLEICRKPVQSIIQKFANFVSLGRYNRELKRLNYDTAFHMYLVIHLNDMNIISIEKNQRVMVKAGKINGGECKQLEYGEKTLREFWMTAEDLKVPGFWRYDPVVNNCQRFVRSILNANGISQFNDFISQDTRTLLPPLVQKFARGLTDIAGIADWIFKGGSNKNNISKIDMIHVDHRHRLI